MGELQTRWLTEVGIGAKTKGTPLKVGEGAGEEADTSAKVGAAAQGAEAGEGSGKPDPTLALEPIMTVFTHHHRKTAQ